MADEPIGDVVAHWIQTSIDTSPRRIELKRLADAGRLVIERMATTAAPPEVIERAAALLETAARELDGPGKVRQYLGFAESANAGGDPHAHFDHSPVMGVANPVAPVVRVEWGVSRAGLPASERSSSEHEQVVMHVRFGSAYEGPPGSVHGGFLAAMFDELLGMTQSLSGQPGMTGTLTVRYRRPTPLHHDLRFEGTLDRVDGRKIFTTGRCFDGDTLTAEAEGLFVRVDFQRIAEMMTSRDGRVD